MKTEKLFTLALATLFAAGCAQEEIPQTVDLNTPIRLQIGLEGPAAKPETRADVPGSAFAVGDQVGFFLGTSETETAADFATITDSKFRNVKFALNPHGWDGTLYWQSTQNWHTLYAYAPYDTDLETDGKTTDYTISSFQDDPADYAAADLLHYAGTPMKATTDAVPVSMKHCMAQLKIVLQPGADVSEAELDAMAPGIRLLNKDKFYTHFTFDLSNGSITAPQISPYVEMSLQPESSASKRVYYAILCPGQTFASGSDFIRLKAADGTPYIYKLNLAGGGNLTVTAGNCYEFTLKVNKAGIQLGSFGMQAWNVTDEKGDADMVVGN